MDERTPPLQHRSAHSTVCHTKWHAGARNEKTNATLATQIYTITSLPREMGCGKKQLEKQTQPLQHRSAHSKASHPKWLADERNGNPNATFETQI